MTVPAVSTTPWARLNKLLQVAPGSVVVIAGERGTGKSTFALQLLRYRAHKAGERVAVMSFDWSKDELTRRLLAAQAGVELDSTRDGTDKRPEKRLLAAAEQIESLVLLQPEHVVSDVAERIVKSRERQTRWFLIDPTHQLIGRSLRSLREAAHAANVVLLLVTHLEMQPGNGYSLPAEIRGIADAVVRLTTRAELASGNLYIWAEVEVHHLTLGVPMLFEPRLGRYSEDAKLARTAGAK